MDLKCGNCALPDAGQLHRNALFPLPPTFVPTSLTHRRHQCLPRPSPDFALPAADPAAASCRPRPSPPPPTTAPPPASQPPCVGKPQLLGGGSDAGGGWAGWVMGDEAMGVGGREGGADAAGKAGELRQGEGRGRATRALRLSALVADARRACGVKRGGSRWKSVFRDRGAVARSGVFLFTADLAMRGALIGLHPPIWCSLSDDE